MMMIRQNVALASSPINTLYPADRCTWTHTYNDTTRQYDIADAVFYGVGISAIDLGDDITLGFIGKSGRFVPITE